ncbi:MAG: hypothetical protein CMF62_03855 [Magnetococcales bacterium]|nr:hypothetical protein [Magnetococcales bacterium]|tara:strand:- start:28763 stop:29647 length:885 start_codon:yes stop_codon:yes gene_type:complete
MVKYIIYSIESKFWNILNKKKLNYLSTHTKYDILNNDDKIFIFCKKKGFVSIVTCKSEIVTNPNNKLKIFKDKMMNMYYVRVSNHIEFKLINLKKCMEYIKKDKVGLKNSQSFSLKYIGQNLNFTEIPCEVGEILEKVFLEQPDDSESDSKSEISKHDKINDSEIEKSIDIETEKTNNSVDLSSNHRNIPILITSEIPFPHNSSKIINSILKNNNFEITNNNDYGLELIRSLVKKKIKAKLIKVIDENEEFDKAIDAFERLEPYETKTITIFNILKHDIYEDCILIALPDITLL